MNVNENETRRLVKRRHCGWRTGKNARPAGLPPHLSLPSARHPSLASKGLDSRAPPEESLHALGPPGIAPNTISSEIGSRRFSIITPRLLTSRDAVEARSNDVLPSSILLAISATNASGAISSAIEKTNLKETLAKEAYMNSFEHDSRLVCLDADLTKVDKKSDPCETPVGNSTPTVYAC